MSSSLQALPENRGVAHIRDRRTHHQERQSEIAWRARLLDSGDAVREADRPAPLGTVAYWRHHAAPIAVSDNNNNSTAKPTTEIGQKPYFGLEYA